MFHVMVALLSKYLSCLLLLLLFLKEVEYYYYYYYYYYRSLVCAAVGTSCYDVRVSWKGLGLVLDICVGGGS